MIAHVSDTRGSKPSLREAQRALTRERICEAAARLFYERGFSSVTMEDIAQAASVSRSTLYVHYPDKIDLSVEIAGAYADVLTALVVQLPGPVPSRIQIEHWLHALAAVVVREHVPATLIVDLSARGEAPEAIGLIGQRLLIALAARLPAFERMLAGERTRIRARAWAEAAMREIGWACTRVADESTEASAARLAVAAEIFERFVHAQIEMEA